MKLITLKELNTWLVASKKTLAIQMLLNSKFFNLAILIISFSLLNESWEF